LISRTSIPEIMMKTLLALVPVLVLSRAFAAEAPASSAGAVPVHEKTHRYVIERTFPLHALEGLDAATKAKVNANNASVGVRWVRSYANEDQTKTYCVYEGPSEDAVRQAAKLNGLPVDRVTEVPVELDPGSMASASPVAAEARHTFVIERTFAPGALDGLDDKAKASVNANNARFGVNWITSYANADQTRTYCICEGPDEAAIRKAASANGIPVDSVTQVSTVLLPQ
jgi:hypothetical protein